jgi:hypothetical protein
LASPACGSTRSSATVSTADGNRRETRLIRLVCPTEIRIMTAVPIVPAIARRTLRASAGALLAFVAAIPVSAFADDFRPDASWGNGGYAHEHSAWGSTYRGRKAIAHANGDIIVVSDMNLPLGYVGITRRNAAGTLMTWPGVDAEYSGGDGQYILWRGTHGWDSCPAVVGALDLKWSDANYFWILVNCWDLTTVVPRILVFHVDGHYAGTFPVTFNDANLVREAVAMDTTDQRLVVLGRYAAGASGGFWTAMLDIGGGSVVQTLGSFPLPGGYSRTEPADIAFRRNGPFGGVTGDYYVLFTRKVSANASDDDFDPCLLSAKASHAPDPGFPGSNSGVRCKWFDEAGGSKKDKGVALTVGTYLEWAGSTPISREKVHVLVDVARSVDDGFGVWALRNRSDDTAFGPGGRRVFGGCATGEPCADPQFGIAATHTPADLAYLGSDIAVVGYAQSHFPAGGGRVDPMLARVDAANGERLQLDSFPSGYGDGQFNSLVIRDARHLVGIGEAKDDAAANAATRVQTLIALTNDDTIFRNGFDS